jgi:hypothetical protein
MNSIGGLVADNLGDDELLALARRDAENGRLEEALRELLKEMEGLRAGHLNAGRDPLRT